MLLEAFENVTELSGEEVISEIGTDVKVRSTLSDGESGRDWENDGRGKNVCSWLLSGSDRE